MAKIYAFSGGCFSGKTTTIRELWNRNSKAIMLEENIRDYLGKSSIDEVRQDPNRYFHLQVQVITGKILREWFYFVTQSRFEQILIDRSLGDSLYYFNQYVDRDMLSRFNKIIYWIFNKFLLFSAWFNFKFVYDQVLEFLPINKKCDDIQYRPKELNSQKEYNYIHYFNERYTKNIITFDLNRKDELNSVISIVGADREF